MCESLGEIMELSKQLHSTKQQCAQRKNGRIQRNVITVEFFVVTNVYSATWGSMAFISNMWFWWKRWKFEQKWNLFENNIQKSSPLFICAKKYFNFSIVYEQNTSLTTEGLKQLSSITAWLLLFYLLILMQKKNNL